MAQNPNIAVAVANAMLDVLAALANNGFLNIYDADIPVSTDTAITDQTLLVSLTMNATAFPSAVDGIITANPISDGTVAATGTATWFRVYKSDGVTPIYQGSAGVGEFDLVLTPSANLSASQPFSCPILTINLVQLLSC